jgi:hypothetical protein
LFSAQFSVIEKARDRKRVGTQTLVVIYSTGK